VIRELTKRLATHLNRRQNGHKIGLRSEASITTAAMPHIDDLLPAFNVKSLQTLVRELESALG